MANKADTTLRPCSCVRCAERKVKCDRVSPCSSCVRHNVECVFVPKQLGRNRQKRLNNEILTERIRRLESFLEEKGIDSSHPQPISDSEPVAHPEKAQVRSTKTPQSQLSPSVDSCSPVPSNEPQVIQGSERFKLIDNFLWTRVVEEFHSPIDALGDSVDTSDTPDSSEAALVLGHYDGRDLNSSHPPPKIMSYLWQAYIENFDPLTKIIHVPSTQPLIEEAAKDITTVSPTFEPLLFAIYSAAVLTLSNAECEFKLQQSRKQALEKYISATKSSLIRAKFMSTTSLVVLQALILHLFAVWDSHEPRAVWSLSGVAIRIAQSLGLEHDGTSLGLTPFETEVRRRVWWQLKSHDSRCAEMCGMAKFRDMSMVPGGTKSPSRIDDADFYPGMTVPAPESTKLTDSVFVMLKWELINFASRCSAELRRGNHEYETWKAFDTETDNGGAKATDLWLKLEEHLEVKYLRYCDPSQPLHLMTQLAARCAVGMVFFMTHHPRRWKSRDEVPLAERKEVWETCLNLLKRHNMIHTNPDLKRFSWQATYSLQWHALIHVLDTLRVDPLNADAVEAWSCVAGSYENNPGMIEMNKVIHMAIGNLCLKAFDNRTIALQNAQEERPTVPEFILQLRRRLLSLKSKLLDGCESTQPSPSLSNEHAEQSTLYMHSKETGLNNHQPHVDVAWSGVDIRNMTTATDRRTPSLSRQVINEMQQSKGIDVAIPMDWEDRGKEHWSDWDQWDVWLAQ